MKILHIINNLGSGGAEKFLVDLVTNFPKSGYEIKVLLLTDRAMIFKYRQDIIRSGAKLNILSHGSVYSPILILKLVTIFKHCDFDIVHVHIFPSLYWVGLAARVYRPGKVLLFTEQSVKNRRINNILYRFTDRFIYNIYNKVIAVSPLVADAISKNTVPKDRVIYIGNGISVDSLKEKSYSRFQLRVEFELPKDSRLILMAARLMYPKDHYTVIEAVKYLPENYYILFAGEGKDEFKLRRYAQGKIYSHRILFLGYRNDVHKLMRSVDVNVLASDYEGMPLVALEALSSGKPFIGSNVEGINDLFSNSNFLFKNKDSAELAKKIIQFTSNDKYKKLVTAEKRAIIRQYSIESIVLEHIDLYGRLLKDLIA